MYKWVLTHSKRHVAAIKGSSSIDSPIYKTAVKSLKNSFKTKADTYGVNVHLVGTDKAKDLIIGSDANTGRIRLTGNQHGAMHWYQTVRADYYDQLLSEVKAPHRNLKGRLVWQKKAGIRNEALDCEVYALHAARHLKIHLWTEQRWQDAERALRQTDLLSAPVVKAATPFKQTGFNEVNAAW